jgi:hypothetical protein
MMPHWLVVMQRQASREHTKTLAHRLNGPLVMIDPPSHARVPRTQMLPSLFSELPIAPVLLLRGASPGVTKAQPVCLSASLSGRVRCQVGCVTDRPMASCRPCVHRNRNSSLLGRVRCQVGCVTDRPIASCRPCMHERKEDGSVNSTLGVGVWQVE